MSDSSRPDDFAALRDRLNNIGTGRRAGESTGGFSSVLGGDMRLEDAISGINRANRTPRPASALGPDPLREALGDAAYRDEPQPLPPAGNGLLKRHTPAPAAPPPTRLPDAPSVPPRDFGLNGGANGHAYPEPGQEGYNEPYGHGPAAYGAYGEGADQGYSDYGGEASGNGYWDPAYGGAAPADGYSSGENYLAPVGGSMLSPDASTAAAEAFNRLADTIMDRASDGTRSMEDTTRDLLRPMLKSWLDENLPRLVEDLVREEIMRVTRRGGR